MTLGNIESIKEKGLELLKNKKNKRGIEIYKSLLYQWSTPIKISKELNKEQHKDLKRPMSSVSRYLNAFDQLGWLESRPVYEGAKRKEFKSTLNPYFEHWESKGIEFSKQEKNFIKKKLEESYALAFNVEDNFIEDIDNIIKQLVYSTLKENLSIFAEKINLRKDSEIPICIKISLKLFDRVTLRILNEYLIKIFLHDLKNIKITESEATKLALLLRDLELKADGKI
jgi:hypothetical protein